jgi:hypothetical protein
MIVMPSGTSSSARASAARSAGRCVRLVHVVEDDRARKRECAEELAEEAAHEAPEILLRLGRELRQRRRRLARERLRSHPEVMQERRAVRVAGVALVPEVAAGARLDVARHERRLAGAGRAAHPHDGPLRGFVEHGEKTRPWQQPRKLGPGQLGERRACGHVANVGRENGRRA